MTLLTLFDAGAVSVMLLSYVFESRPSLWVLVFVLACAASSLYGWLSRTWPFGVVEGIRGFGHLSPCVAGGRAVPDPFLIVHERNWFMNS